MPVPLNRGNAPPRGDCGALKAQGGAWHRTGSALQAVALLGIVLLVAWTHVFLGVHELKHIGHADASACKFTLIASTLGGSGTATAPSLPVPPAIGVLAPLAAPACPLQSETATQRARAPPALA